MRILAACKNCSTQYEVSGQKTGDTLHCRCGGLIVVPEVRAQEARLVRCASCGAVRGSGGLNCEFCGARFSTVDKGWGSMCPQCFCRLPSEAQFCVECGLKIAPQKLDAIVSDMLCPRCGVALQRRLVERIEVYECVACVGLWAPTATFEAICQDTETRSQAVTLMGLAKRGRRRFELTADEQVRYIPCPVCKRLMNRRNFGGISGVIVDLCRDDGVWLDNQELNRIVQFIEAGGLDKAREFEALERAHRERMKPKTAAPIALDLEPISGREAGMWAGSGGPASLLGQVLVEVAKSFLKGR